ncbi:MAG TPA: VCBS repeat-containing protein [Candidatus Eisenbacteria bacterium]|nr:VCBS repeat-containing protein [Candidatus Eisenbacteria bacterium]
MLRDPSTRRPLAFGLLLAAACLAGASARAGDYCPEYVGSIAKEVASADFDGDGLADFAVTVEPNAVAIVLGQTGLRPTRFTGAIPTGGAVEGIAAGDLDGDGDADLLVAQPTLNALRVLLGHGDGTFSYGDPFDAGEMPFRPALADLDGDGDLDVAVMSSVLAAGPAELSLLLNAGDGSFAPRVVVDLSPYLSDQNDLACGDIDGDGDADVVVLRRAIVSSAIVKTYVIVRSNGDGTFAAPATLVENASTSAIALGDINHDGRADLVARDGDISFGGVNTRRFSTYFGRADGSFDPPVRVPTVVAGLGGRIRLGDLNGDGNLDAAVTAGPIFPLTDGCSASFVGTAIGDGAGGFVETPSVRSGGNFSTALAVSDADGDGTLDVATTGNQCGTLVLHRGNGDGTLAITSHPARGFVDKQNEIIKLNSNKSSWCLYFEAVGGVFDPTSEGDDVHVLSTGTGTISDVSRDFGKGTVLGDADNNGIPDLRVCFAKDRIRQLFSNLSGRQTVTLLLRSQVGRPGCVAEGTLTIDVMAGGGNNAAALLRSDGEGGGLRLSYRAERTAPSRLRLYDVSGRLVKSVSLPVAAAGWNDARVDDRDDAGRRLPSGVFFYRLEAGGDPIHGKVVIAR